MIISNISGVQIIGGVLAILSGVLLVVFFAKLDELVSRQYYALFQVDPRPEIDIEWVVMGLF